MNYKVWKTYLLISITGYVLLLFSCTREKDNPYAFDVLNSYRTGLDFANVLNSSDSFNLFKYMYFYNGGGVGIGDFSNDGLPDIRQKIKDNKLNEKDRTLIEKFPQIKIAKGKSEFAWKNTSDTNLKVDGEVNDIIKLETPGYKVFTISPRQRLSRIVPNKYIAEEIT